MCLLHNSLGKEFNCAFQIRKNEIHVPLVPLRRSAEVSWGLRLSCPWSSWCLSFLGPRILSKNLIVARERRAAARPISEGRFIELHKWNIVRCHKGKSPPAQEGVGWSEEHSSRHQAHTREAEVSLEKIASVLLTKALQPLSTENYGCKARRLP